MVGFDQVLVLFIMILFGFIAKKAKLVTEGFQNEVSGFVINVALPAFLITSVSISISKEMLKNSGIMLGLSVIIFATSVLLSHIILNGFKIKGQSKDIYQFILTFSNTAFMGYPVIAVAYGQIGVFYAAVFNVTFNILVWSLGVYFMKRNGSHSDVQNEKLGIMNKIKKMMNPPIYAFIFAFILALLKIKLPPVIFDTLKMVGDVTTPLIMLYIGFILAEVHIKELIGDFWLYIFSFIRLIVFPIFFYFMLRPFVSGVMLGVAVLLMGMPAAVNTAVIAARYDNDYKLASKIVFLSTLASIITIPIMIKLLVA